MFQLSYDWCIHTADGACSACYYYLPINNWDWILLDDYLKKKHFQQKDHILIFKSNWLDEHTAELGLQLLKITESATDLKQVMHWENTSSKAFIYGQIQLNVFFCELSSYCADNARGSFAVKQGIIDPAGTETWQIFSSTFVIANFLKSCLPLLAME